jgi:hypothetical protein
MNQLKAIGPSHLELSFSVAGAKEEEEVPLVVADRKKSARGELLQLAQSVKDAAPGYLSTAFLERNPFYSLRFHQYLTIYLI